MSTVLTTDVELKELVLLKKLHSGGQATVWLAKEKGATRREVAFRAWVYPQVGESTREKTLKRIKEQEATIWPIFQGSHHVVQLHYHVDEVVEIDEIPFRVVGFVMEYAAGGDLWDYQRSSSFQNIPLKDKLKILIHVASGLEWGHRRGVLHLDVKPQNVLMYFDEKTGGFINAKLCDFGLAGLNKDQAHVQGTPRYMSPEQFNEGDELTSASDIYSLGVLAYEVVTGRYPYQLPPASEPLLASFANIHKQSEPERRLLQELGLPQLESLILRMTSKQPLDRPSAADVVHQLGRIRNAIAAGMVRDWQNKRLVRRNAYRWNPAVHDFIGDKLYYFFIRMPSISDATKWLVQELQSLQIHGFSLYHLQGRFNHVLRVWLKESKRDELDKLLRQRLFAGNVLKTQAVFAADSTDIFTPCPRLDMSCRDDLLALIADCANPSSQEDETSKLQQKNLITSTLNGSDHAQHRCFVRLIFEDDGIDPEDLAEAVTDAVLRLRRALHSGTTPVVEELSVYTGTCAEKGHVRRAILLKFRLRSFFDLHEVLRTKIEPVSAIFHRRQCPFEIECYMEATEKSIHESDDGSILGDVYEHLAMNPQTDIDDTDD